MLKLVIANQKGGVAKTTTAIAAARYFSENGHRVLLVDTDPQGCISGLLGIKDAGKNLFNFLIEGMHVQECSVPVLPNLHVMGGDRQTAQAEALLNAETMKEASFLRLFPRAVENNYDVILFDCAPSISLLQTCAMIYAQQVVVPVAMDVMSLQGAASCLQTTVTLTDNCRRGGMRDVNIQALGLIPVMVDRRYQITQQILEGIEVLHQRFGTPVLPGIRTDAAVKKAERARRFLFDFDIESKARQDYIASFDALSALVKDQLPHGESIQAIA